MSDLLDQLQAAFGSPGISQAEKPTTISVAENVTVDLATGVVTDDPLPDATAALIERAIADAQEDPVGARRRWQIERAETVLLTFLNGDPGPLSEDDPIDKP